MRAILVVVGGVVVFATGFGAGRLVGRGDEPWRGDGAGVGRAGVVGGRAPGGGAGGALSAGGVGGGGGQAGSGARRVAAGRVSSVSELMDLVNPVDWVESNIRMREALAGLSAAALAGLVEEIRKDPKAQQQQWMLYGAIGRAWAETDLEGALEFATGDENEQVKQALLPAVVLELAKRDPDRAERLIQDIPNLDSRMNLTNQLASVLVETDPERAIGLVMEVKGRNGSWMMNNVYQRWASDDLEAAKAFVGTITNSEDREGAVQAVARAMAAEDLDAALAWVGELKSARERTVGMQMVTNQVAMMDVGRALELVESMPRNAQRGEVMGTVMQTWMQTDRAAALSWLEGIENPIEKNQILSHIGWQLGRSDPVGTLDLALEMKSNNHAHNLLNAAFGSMTDDQIADSVPKITALEEGRTKQTAISQLLERWSRSDPVKAMSFAAELPAGGDYDRVVSNAAQWWATEDGAAAAKWVMGIGDEDRRKAALGGVVQAWSNREPEMVARFLDGVSDAELAGELVSQLASTWGPQDREAALAWAGGLDGKARGNAIGKVVGSIAGQDPYEAMGLFDRAMIEDMGEDEAKQVASQIASQLGQWDSEQAVKWAAGLPEGIRGAAVDNAIRQWVETSPMAVSKWLLEVPAGEMKDTATSRLVNSIERTDPESAFVWAVSVGDGDKRVELISRVARRWGNKDEAAAMEAVLATDLSDEQKATILKGFE